MRSKSILQRCKHCWVCGSTEGLEEHHVFYGTAYRKQSERYGLKVWLCREHHRGNTGVHGHNRELGLKLMRYAQRKFEETHTRDEFIQIFGKNRLDDERERQAEGASDSGDSTCLPKQGL